MKNILIIGIIVSGIFTACANQNSMSRNDLFEKKQECAKLIPKVEQEFADWKSSYTEGHKLYELFYSPEKNSCLKAYTLIWGMTERVMVYAIDDAYTKENIFQISRWKSEDFSVFEKRIKELKWE